MSNCIEELFNNSFENKLCGISHTHRKGSSLLSQKSCKVLPLSVAK